MATPTGTAAAARQLATGYALRAPPSATCRALKDLHHFLGHQLQVRPEWRGRGPEHQSAGVETETLPCPR